MIYKKTSRSVLESYAEQKQREEVVGRLHIFLADYLWPKIQISFVKVTEILMYLTIFNFKKNIKIFFYRKRYSNKYWEKMAK